MSRGNLDFIGCGALNWDIFFEVEDLQTIKFQDIDIIPGRETSLERDQFLKFLDFLEKNGKFLFACGGGSSANTIYALSLWGFKTAFIGAVGEDNFGKNILEEFEKVNLNTENILKKGETSLALILLDKNKDRFIAVSPGNSEKFLLDNIPKRPIKGFFHFSSFASKAGQKFQKAILNKYNLRISFDPGEIYVNLGKDFLIPWLKATQYLFITEYELQKLRISLDNLYELGIEKIFLKKGKKGAAFYSKNKSLKLPVYKVEKIIDNTGAGDYFNAGILAGIKMRLEDEKVLKLGLYSAALSLRDYGRKGCLNQKEFQNYINLLK